MSAVAELALIVQLFGRWNVSSHADAETSSKSIRSIVSVRLPRFQMVTAMRSSILRYDPRKFGESSVGKRWTPICYFSLPFGNVISRRQVTGSNEDNVSRPLYWLLVRQRTQCRNQTCEKHQRE